jgi:hypothetical protein
MKIVDITYLRSPTVSLDFSTTYPAKEKTISVVYATRQEIIDEFKYITAHNSDEHRRKLDAKEFPFSTHTPDFTTERWLDNPITSVPMIFPPEVTHMMMVMVYEDETTIAARSYHFHVDP